jgi:hypothetical protein
VTRLSLAFPTKRITFRVKSIRTTPVVGVFMGGVMANCGLYGGMRLLIRRLSKCFRLLSCTSTIELASNGGGWIRCRK